MQTAAPMQSVMPAYTRGPPLKKQRQEQESGEVFTAVTPITRDRSRSRSPPRQEENKTVIQDRLAELKNRLKRNNKKDEAESAARAPEQFIQPKIEPKVELADTLATGGLIAAKEELVEKQDADKSAIQDRLAELKNRLKRNNKKQNS